MAYLKNIDRHPCDHKPTQFTDCLNAKSSEERVMYKKSELNGTTTKVLLLDLNPSLVGYSETVNLPVV
jgi:hypothetical protein